LPNYSSEEVMKKKITIAMEFCGEIDGDGGANPTYEDRDFVGDD